jgi:glycosyltransferase involved in cell wall biosynthesis
MTPAVSIIIPYYGAADPQLMQRCLASVRQQGDDDLIEVIVTDDDGGKGIFAARNQGIRQAQGDYLLFVDADDYLLPDCIARCLPRLQQDVPDILSFGIIQTTERKGGAKEEGLPQQDTPPRQDTLPVQYYPTGADYMRRHNFFGSVWHHFFRRRFLADRSLLFSAGLCHEDEEFLLKAYALAGVTLITPTPFYVYVRRPFSVTHLPSLAMRRRRLSDFRAMLRRVSAFVRTLPPHSLARRAACRRRFFLRIDYVRQILRNIFLSG